MKSILFLSLWLASSALAQATRPVVVAHRGASGYLPEHTLAAKALAYGYNVDFIEQDLVLTKDGVPVVLHDIYLDTVTDVARQFPGRQRNDGRYYAIDFTLAEVKQLHVTERFNRKTGAQVFAHRFPAGQSSFQVSTLEEELQLIQGLNHSTGRRIGIYPELKQPKWHREQGHDLSKIVLPILAHYGYITKQDACWLQCFELEEVMRLRTELGWKGRLLLLISGTNKAPDDTDQTPLCTPAGLTELAKTVDGIGPSINRIVTWDLEGKRQITDLVKNAHAQKLTVHPYTVRIDELPEHCPSVNALHEALFRDAAVDGLFTDFPDLTIGWVDQNMGPRGSAK